MQIPLGNYVFRVRWLVVAVMVVAMWSCVRLGLWQWHKAEQKQAIIQAMTHHGQAIVVQGEDLSQASKVQGLHLQTVTLKGRYLPQFSFFLDNQVAPDGRAGFHVLTPLLLTDQQHVIWVNRGWVAGFTDHQRLPEIVTTTAPQEIRGLFWVQTRPGYRLDQPVADWQQVQPVIDFDDIRKHVPYLMPNAIVKLDPAMPEGYLRQWEMPAGQVEKHLSYAYQWFGFALAGCILGLFQMIEKRS